MGFGGFALIPGSILWSVWILAAWGRDWLLGSTSCISRTWATDDYIPGAATSLVPFQLVECQISNDFDSTFPFFSTGCLQLISSELFIGSVLIRFGVRLDSSTKLGVSGWGLETQTLFWHDELSMTRHSHHVAFTTLHLACVVKPCCFLCPSSTWRVLLALMWCFGHPCCWLSNTWSNCLFGSLPSLLPRHHWSCWSWLSQVVMPLAF